MEGRQRRYRYWELTEEDKKACDSFRTFFELAGYLEENNICYRPGCTTCGCEKYRQMVVYMGSERINDIIKESSVDEIYKRLDFRWHDAMEVLLNRRGMPVIDESLPLVKAYYGKL